MSGIHHVTAIAGDPQRNLDFYAGTLGLRLVKLTVNYDDPDTYHFYFGDELGRPGSILTFFPWPMGQAGRHGAGQVGEVALAVPRASLGYWLERLLTRGVPYQGPTQRFDETVLVLRDPDGLLLEIVATPRVDRVEPWPEGPVPAEHAVRGVHGVTIWEDGDTGSAALLADQLGFHSVGESEGRLRLETSAQGAGTVVDIRRAAGFWRGSSGVGTVHHVAFRVPSRSEQDRRREALMRLGLEPTEVIDRHYFHSVYFREPGGVLFELATEAPGFTADEPAAELGSSLKLPPAYEPNRARIAGGLPPIRLPHVAAPGGMMATVDLGFRHRFLPGSDPAAPPLLLLHGTGGTEDDLLPLGEALSPGSARLSPRGQVLENGMPRFFRRLAEGVFDLDDLRARTGHLADFVEAARREYGIAAPIAVGFSNGANIGASVLLLRPGILAGALLLRPMVPLVPDPLPDLRGIPVQIVAGRADPIVPPPQTEALAELLRRSGAEVAIEWLPGGHALTPRDVEIGRRWLERW